MGLYAYAKGLTEKECYDCGYITFGVYRQEVAKAFNKRIGELYKKYYRDIELTECEIKEWNKLCNNDLDIFLFHSDCEGKFTPQECRKIYNAMKDLKIDMIGHNYGFMGQYNMHKHWLNIFKHCYTKRVNLYFE